MDKREAHEIFLAFFNICGNHKTCSNCPFKTTLFDNEVCVLTHFHISVIAKLLKDLLRQIEQNSAKFKDVSSVIFKQNEHTSKLIDEAIREHRENVKNELESGRIVTEIVIPKGVERGVLPSSVVKNDNVNHPKHYCKGGLECIQVIEAQLTPQQYEGYLYGNVLKYMWRWPDKNGLEDLRKAKHYLEWLIEEVKKNG